MADVKVTNDFVLNTVVINNFNTINGPPVVAVVQI